MRGVRGLLVLFFIVSGCSVFTPRYSIVSDISSGKNKCKCIEEEVPDSYLGYIYVELSNKFDDVLCIYIDGKYYCWRYFYTEESTSSTLCIISIPFDIRRSKNISIRDIRGRELYRIEVSKDLEKDSESGALIKEGRSIVLTIWRWDGEWRHGYSDKPLPKW